MRVREEQIAEMTAMIFKFYPQIRKFFRSLVAIKTLQLSMTQLVCLQAVERQGQVTMTKLANELQMSSQQLTKVVDHLADLGMAQRTQDEHNRRQLLVEVTAKGSKTLSMLRREFVRKVAILSEKLPAGELDKLYDSVKCLDAYLDKLHKVMDNA